MTMEFWKAALIRALKTVCQTAIAMIGTATVMSDVKWQVVVSASALAGLLSILTSIATGLPEVQLAETLYSFDNKGGVDPDYYIEDDNEDGDE